MRLHCDRWRDGRPFNGLSLLTSSHRLIGRYFYFRSRGLVSRPLGNTPLTHFLLRKVEHLSCSVGGNKNIQAPPYFCLLLNTSAVAFCLGILGTSANSFYYLFLTYHKQATYYAAYSDTNQIIFIRQVENSYDSNNPSLIPYISDKT